jgi:hypothetical protein
MATNYNYFGNLVTSGLVLDLDAAKVASYPGTGTTWYDISGNNLTGSLVNGPTFSNTGKSSSIVFDGTNDYSIINSKVYSLTGGTLNIWVKKISGTSGTLVVIGSYGGSGDQRSPTFYSNNSNNILWEFSNLFAQNTGVSFNTNIWYNLSMTYDSNYSVKVYINGSLIQSGSATSPGDFPNQITIGSYYSPNPSSYINASIPVVQIYNRALSATEITQNFNALRGRYGI